MNKSKFSFYNFLKIYSALIFIISHFVFYAALTGTTERGSLRILVWLLTNYFLPIAYFLVAESNRKKYYIWTKESFNNFSESLNELWHVIYNRSGKHLVYKETIDKSELQQLLTNNNESYHRLIKDSHDKSDDFGYNFYNFAGFYYTAITISVATFCL